LILTSKNIHNACFVSDLPVIDLLLDAKADPHLKASASHALAKNSSQLDGPEGYLPRQNLLKSS